MSVLRMPLCSAKDSAIIAARFLPMPSTSISRSGALSSTSSARAPKWFTMSLAVAGPTPFTSPEARNFSTPDLVSGRVAS